MTTSLPRFVQYGAHLFPPAPYVHRGVKMHSFPIQADRDRIQRLCDQWFKVPSGGAVEYVVLSHWLFVTCLHIDNVSSEDAAFANYGTLSETDFGIWAVVLRVKPLALLPRWMPIHLFVDSGEATFAGREIYGFPKSLGKFNVPPHAPAMEPFTVDALVIPTENSHGAWQRVIEVQPVPGNGQSPVIWTTLEQVFAHIAGMIAEHASEVLLDWVPEGLKEKLVPGLVSIALFKQFPGSTDTTKACYQAIMEAHAAVLAFRNGGLTECGFNVQVSSYHTHPYETVLGLDPGWQNVPNALWLDFDFIVRAPEELWDSSDRAGSAFKRLLNTLSHTLRLRQ